MSIEKSEVKIGTAHELGCRLDDALESLTKDLYRLEGSVNALRHAVQSADVIYKMIDRDMDDGKIDLKEASRTKKYIERYVNVLNASASQTENNREVQTGKMQAMQLAVQIAKKFKDDEESKMNTLKTVYTNLKNQKEQEEKEPRPAGIRPGPSIKDRRLAAELQKRETDTSASIDKSDAPVISDETEKSKGKRQKK